MKRKTPEDSKGPTPGEAEKGKGTNESAGASDTAKLSAPHSRRRVAKARGLPAQSVSRRLPSPAIASGLITLARLFSRKRVNWPRQFKEQPFRPGPPREIGLLGAVFQLVSAPVLGVPRMVHHIAGSLRRSASREPRPTEKLRALGMKLELGEITEAEFQREKARIIEQGREQYGGENISQ